METGPRGFENVGCNERDDDGEVSKESVRKEHFAKPSGSVCKRQAGTERIARFRQGYGRHLAAGQLDEGTAEEISEAHAEGRHGETGHVLIGPEVNREEAIQKTHDERAQKRGPGRDQYANQRIERGCILLIQESPDDAADTADVHDAGNSEVQVSGFFGNGFTGTSEKKRYALGDSTRYK